MLRRETPSLVRERLRVAWSDTLRPRPVPRADAPALRRAQHLNPIRGMEGARLASCVLGAASSLAATRPSTASAAPTIAAALTFSACAASILAIGKEGRIPSGAPLDLKGEP